MSRIVLIMFKFRSIGGIESMILRLADYLKKQGHRVLYASDEINGIDNLEINDYMDALLDLKSDIIDYRELIEAYNNSSKIRSILFNSNSDITILVFNYYEYFIAQDIKIKSPNPNRVNIVFYVVHPISHTCIDLVTSAKKKIIKKTLHNLYKDMLIDLYMNDIIYFMDEECIEFNERHFNISLDKAYNNILRLPMNINEITFNNKEIYNQNEFNILTIARLDFPFKGYVLGLVNDFAKLKQKYKDISLTIIGDGSGMTELLTEINKQDSQIQKDIHVLGRIEYRNLSIYFNKAKLFIGMGTTILDACNNGVPAITVHSYTKLNKALGFFYEHPEKLGNISDNTTIINAIELIEKAINMNENEYLSLCIKSFEAFKRIYDIETFTNKIFNVRNSDNLESIKNYKIQFIKISKEFVYKSRKLIRKI
jgi:glycosyltransferase involved in cell wall biosynthesis